MTDVESVNLVPNGNGVQLYLGRGVLDDSKCPLRQGQTAPSIVIDGVGVLLARNESIGERIRRQLAALDNDPDGDSTHV